MRGTVDFGTCRAPGVQHCNKVALTTDNVACTNKCSASSSTCYNTIQGPASFVPIIRGDALSLRWCVLCGPHSVKIYTEPQIAPTQAVLSYRTKNQDLPLQHAPNDDQIWSRDTLPACSPVLTHVWCSAKLWTPDSKKYDLHRDPHVSS